MNSKIILILFFAQNFEIFELENLLKIIQIFIENFDDFFLKLIFSKKIENVNQVLQCSDFSKLKIIVKKIKK